MLDRLSIIDFAVARSVVIEPGPGLCVFTGETGAGKSLVVDALGFLFGARRGREVIATGAERAAVEAIVSLPETMLTVERVVGASGRTAARIDGQPASLEDLRELGGRVVDIHGQSEQLGILRPAVQLAILDDFASLGSKRAMLAATVRSLRDVRRAIEALSTDRRERERLADQFRFEVAEIDDAQLLAGEDIALREEHHRLSNPERLREAGSRALAALEASPIGEAARAVAEVAMRDPGARSLAELASGLESSTADLIRELRRYLDAIDDDPGRLAAVEERLDVLARLCRKYGDTVDDVIAYGEEARSRLAELTGAGTSLEELLVGEEELLSTLADQALELSRSRRAAAGSLVNAIARELEDLGMAHASLSIGFACEDDRRGPRVALPEYELLTVPRVAADLAEPRPCGFTETGVDRIEFFASFNPGETPRPLASVASGGETSRFLLALTTVLGTHAERRIVVLDEVDEGVGGRAGGLIGRALARLAVRHQVLCITHLPQVAAYGQHHYVVTKQTDGERTWSDVRAVEGEARELEIAAMLGGATPANRAAARDLLATAHRRI